MEVKSVDADAIFRVFTACPNDVKALILDVRPHKEFKKSHITQAFCVRLSSNGKVLADYSQSQYDLSWSQDCWWNRPVFVYGPAALKKDHPVVAFLQQEKRCRFVGYYKEGFEEFEKQYPFLCTASVKANSTKRYPSQILPQLLYLGDWGHAEDYDRLEEIKVKGIMTVHNHPSNLKPPANIKHLKVEMPDVETADISQHLQAAYEFIEAARERGYAVLVHCGAGVSRSATVCMMYLMRRFGWNAQKAKEYCTERRSLVCPNDGFWRTLCALEAKLGISDRSDPNATMNFKGDDAPAEISDKAIGEKVSVIMVTPKELRGEQQSKGKRAREDEGEGEATKQQTSGSGLKVTFEITKPEGFMGKLVVGPMKPFQRCVFGRAPSCDVVLEHLSISRAHAEIIASSTGLTLTDLGSGHGTKLNDAWIKPHNPKSLQVGSAIYFGASTRCYKVEVIEGLPKKPCVR